MRSLTRSMMDSDGICLSPKTVRKKSGRDHGKQQDENDITKDTHRTKSGHAERLEAQVGLLLGTYTVEGRFRDEILFQPVVGRTLI